MNVKGILNILHTHRGVIGRASETLSPVFWFLDGVGGSLFKLLPDALQWPRETDCPQNRSKRTCVHACVCTRIHMCVSLCVYVCAGAHVPLPGCGGHRVTLEREFSPAVYVPEIELRSSGLEAVPFTHWLISLALFLVFSRCLFIWWSRIHESAENVTVDMTAQIHLLWWELYISVIIGNKKRYLLFLKLLLLVIICCCCFLRHGLVM